MSEMDYKSVMSQIAMRNGLRLGLLFVLLALSLLMYQWGILAVGLFLSVGIAIPIFIVVLGIQYRDKYLGGYASYVQLVAYLSWVYLLSMILLFLSHYFTFRVLFSDPTFVGMMEQSAEMVEQILQNNADIETLRTSYDLMTPLRVATNITTSALFFGIIYVYIIALFIRKKPLP